MRSLHLALASTMMLASLSQPARGGTGSAWTADDLLLAESAHEMHVSPDGRLALWVKSAMNADQDKVQDRLMLGRLDSGEEIALTSAPADVSSPRFSPDGKSIAFLSDRALPEGDDDDSGSESADEQIWLIRVAGGEPRPLSHLDRSPQALEWRDNNTLLFLAQESPSRRELAEKTAKDDSEVVDEVASNPPVRLFSLDVASGDVSRLTTNTDWIDLLAVSPDGHWAVTRHQQSLSFQYDSKTPPKTLLLDLTTGESRPILGEGRQYPEQVFWQSDSKGFLFVGLHSNHPTYLLAAVAELNRFDLATAKASRVDLGWDKGLAGADILPTPDGFLALLADGMHHQAVRFGKKKSAATKTPLEGEHAGHIFDWAASPDGRTLVYLHSTASKLPQWYRARLDGAKILDPQPLTKLNPSFAAKPVPRAEVIHFAGAHGDQVEGLLRYPFDYQEGQKRPLILAIHGGPAGADYDSWRGSVSKPVPLWLARGAFVLEVNYHGSSDYGLAWLESIGGGKYYELEIPDLEAGVDSVIARGLVDPDKLALSGWSNGGILSAELITRTHRYKAASIGAADVEWASDWANVDFGASFDNYYFGASPLENPQLYVQKSPFYRLAEVTTPTLIFTGTLDRNVPPHQSWSLFRALQQLGKAEARLVLFPGEPHGPRRYVHQKRKIEEELAWLDRYLFAKSAEESAALKPGSKLALALARAGAHRVGDLLGVDKKGFLAPEVVPFRGLELGRFEVTRSQYAAFDPTYSVLPGSENLPATGISFEHARAYCNWLTTITGERYRLPREEEASYLKASPDGNVLDRWAGYPPRPEDVPALEKLSAGMPGPAPLLSEVGRYDAQGDPEKVFDLGGNAAEWVVGKDDRGLALGGSADRPVDDRSDLEPGEAYRGFRVVREAGAPPAAPPAKPH
ncbi:MAG: prolyl oligopeptidase family serine peptidase [Thermoanaerobaculia bacterium]